MLCDAAWSLSALKSFKLVDDAWSYQGRRRQAKVYAKRVQDEGLDGENAAVSDDGAAGVAFDRAAEHETRGSDAGVACARRRYGKRREVSAGAHVWCACAAAKAEGNRLSQRRRCSPNRGKCCYLNRLPKGEKRNVSAGEEIELLDSPSLTAYQTCDAAKFGQQRNEEMSAGQHHVWCDECAGAVTVGTVEPDEMGGGNGHATMLAPYDCGHDFVC